MVLPVRDEAALSLGTGVLPMLFIASLLLTFLAAPISSHFLSLPFLSKSKALLIMYRFFGASLVLFFILYSGEAKIAPSLLTKKLKLGTGKESSLPNMGLRVCFYIWIALLNLFTTSSLWARLADVMNSEAGSRLFGFVGAGATLGQLVGSVLAVIMAPFGSVLLLLSALFMEFGARCALGISEDRISCLSTLSSESAGTQAASHSRIEVDHSDLHSPSIAACGKFSAALEGVKLILASGYLIHVCSFLWLTAVVSSFFYFQRTSVVAGTVQDALGRRMLLAKINSLTAVFILFGQLTITGQFLTYAGITVALCASPTIAFINMTAISISPTPLVIAIAEALRKVSTYVLTKPAREILFTVLSHEEKYKAKVLIDTFVQRLGDAAAAGIYELIGSLLLMGPSSVAVCALPVCFAWFFTALTLGRRQQALAKTLAVVSEGPNDTCI